MSVYHSGMVDLRNSFHASSSHALEVHCETQLLDRSGNTARADNAQERATTVLAFVVLSPLTMTILRNLCGVTFGAVHFNPIRQRSLP
jgi:hypothetical protein